ncbi:MULTISPECIES: serine/threonine protein kinase [Candidatus Ichthyocystis]|uniref:non-specific serine/threonine protein kinase n=1 Tax=Candidatus Ichthyocystis hellenicum TaxID=1561003 RepID=A0A0S4M1V9_9BURK|nr:MULTISPECIES: serine/threonine-protein kinase [Ichthyocystis]CUT17275.1 Serine/threonine-protein kinase PrkC [Candidatus Ichthyocystis hellenicum]
MRKQKSKPLPHQYRLLDYTILEVLSTGGFSIVYLAKDRRGSLVVIKEYVPANFAYRQVDGSEIVIAAGKEKSFKYGMRCFFQEGHALAKLSHPNVVRILNFFRANGTVYLVLRYEEGQTLYNYIKMRVPHGFISEQFLLKVFIHLLSGVRKIHSCRFIHLDIKPANIYLRKDGTPVLIDFGASRTAFPVISPEKRGVVPMYTHGYASPEQYNKSGLLGPWSDFYALGASLYACMGLKAPQAANERMKEDKLIPAKILLSGRYSDELIDLVDRCLSLDTVGRPGSGREIQSILISILRCQERAKVVKSRYVPIVC